MTQTGVYYVGLDIHKKTISFCVQRADGSVVQEGVVKAERRALQAWAEGLKHPWRGAMEATMFTGWVYDCLKEYAVSLEVGNAARLKVIAQAKHKSDRLDARALTNLLRCDYFPSCYMAPQWMRLLKMRLRYRTELVHEAVRFMNRNAGLLMQTGAVYNKQKLHQKKYFSELLTTLEEVPACVKELLRLGFNQIQVLESLQRELVRDLANHPQLKERVERLKTIPGVGDITALTWALEVGEPERFSSIAQAVSYCGLCPGRQESGGRVYKQRISKQRNPHLQQILIEAAKLAPRYNLELKAYQKRLKDRDLAANEASLSVARKLVAYLLAVDKEKRDFEVRVA